MFTKTQIIAAATLVAAVSVSAAPAYNDAVALEARTHGNGEWITPSPGKNRAAKVRQSHEIAAVEHHKAQEPAHPAVAQGNTAHVHDSFHSTHGGPSHATVNYNNPQGQHVTTLHIAKDGTRLQGDAQPPHHNSGTHAPPNSPKHRREYLERRTHGNGEWISPSPGKNRAAKIRQSHEIAAVEHHKAQEPSHPAVAQGNTAHVHDSFHSTHGGPSHATVNYNNPQGQHVTTLHIAKDGTRLQGDAQPPHHNSGTHAPPNSPKHRREYVEEYLDFLRRELMEYDELD